MDIAGEYTFDAPRDIVWKAIQDPQVLGSVMPGGEGFEEVGENQYKGALKVKVGPVQGTFTADLTLSDVVAPESYSIDVDGKGKPGFVKANGSLKLEDRGDQTFMEYTGTANIGGRIASVGQRLMDSTARSIIRQSLEGLNEYLKVQVAQQQVQAQVEAVVEETPETIVTPEEETVGSPVTEEAPPQPAPSASEPDPTPAVPDYKPPSQLELMFNVARDVFNDFVPPAMRPVVAIVVIVVLFIILRALFT